MQTTVESLTIDCCNLTLQTAAVPYDSSGAMYFSISIIAMFGISMGLLIATTVQRRAANADDDVKVFWENYSTLEAAKRRNDKQKTEVILSRSGSKKSSCARIAEEDTELGECSSAFEATKIEEEGTELDSNDGRSRSPIFETRSKKERVLVGSPAGSPSLSLCSNAMTMHNLPEIVLHPPSVPTARKLFFNTQYEALTSL